MTCPAPSRGVYLTYLIQGLILIASAASILAGEYLLGLSAGLAFLLTLAPAIVTRNLRLCLPWEISLFIAVSLYLHIMGLAGGYYVSLAPYYDKLTHLVSSAAIAFIAFFIAIIAGQRGEIRLTTPTIVAFILTTTLAAGAIWEIAEFAIDQVFGTNLQLGNTDTMGDLIMDLIGGMIVAGFAAIILESEGEGRFIRLFTGWARGAEPACIIDDPVDSAQNR